MILNTERLFPKLLTLVQADTILDVGSMDATHSLRFRGVLPEARIIAFEANPLNCRAIQANPDVRQAVIEVEHKAVSNKNGTLTFNVENVPDGPGSSWRKGISSIHTRLTNSKGMTTVDVEAVRLDTFLATLDPKPEFVAVWMDVEGAAYEALEGFGSASEQIRLIHVEVETKPMWEGQKLKPEVERLAAQMGFVNIARGPNEDQHDIVLMRPHDLEKLGRSIDCAVRTARREDRISRIGSLPSRAIARLARVFGAR